MICPICSGEKNQVLVERKNISPYQNRLYKTKFEAVNIKRADIRIVICSSCGFVFNSNFDESIELYNEEYNNDQNESEIFRQHIERIVDELLIDTGGKIYDILEIGCGKDAVFLKKICGKLGTNYSATAYDPSCKGVYKQDNITVFNKLYTLEDGKNHRDVDLIILRHVIEHISNPMELLNNLLILLKGYEKNSVLFLETPNVEWIFENGAWFDFCYEHCSYFSPITFSILLKKLGMCIEKLNSSFNEQYMELHIKNISTQKDSDKNDNDLKKLNEKAMRYRDREDEIINKCTHIINEIKRRKEKVILWGVGAKSSMFLNILDPNNQYIDFIVDINPRKQGLYMSGTGHKILSPNKVIEFDIDNIIIMNSNYEKEISEMINRMSEKARNIIVLEEIWQK